MTQKEKILDRAQKYIQKGALDKAAVEYKSAVSLDPTDVSIRLRLGDFYVKLDRSEDAVREYTDVARIYTNKGFYLKAIAVYKQILKLDEANLDVHNKLADLYTRQRLIADAVSEYSYIAGFYEKKGRTAEAFELVKKMAGVDPENLGVKLKLAEMHLKLGYEKDAIEEYGWAFEKFLSQGKLDKAEKIVQDLYKIRPDEPRVIEWLCEFYKKNGNRTEFLRHARALLNAFKGAGNIEKCEKLAREIFEVEPADALARGFVGEVKAEEAAPAMEEKFEEPLIEFPEEKAAAEERVEEKAPGKPVEEPLITLPKEMEEAIEPAPVEKEPPPVEEELFEVTLEEEEVEAPPLAEATTEVAPSEGPVETITAEPVEVFEMAGEFEVPSEPAPVAVPEEELKAAKVFEEECAAEYIDLSKELGVEEALEKLVGAWKEGEAVSTLEEFRTGVGERLGKEDIETHHNLGIAYMEMELYDDAVREFKLSLNDPSLEFDAYTRLGLCSMSLGSTDDAIGYYFKALKIKGRGDIERKGLLYELGLAYEAAGKYLEATGVFKSVAEMDPQYRDVSEKIREIEAAGSPIPGKDNLIEVELL